MCLVAVVFVVLPSTGVSPQQHTPRKPPKPPDLSTEKAEALVIRQADFSESSRVVTFFSKEFGKFSALAKGARRLKGPFDAAIDLLSRCRIVFIRKSSGSLDLLTQASLINRFRPVGTSLTSLYGGYYVADLLNGLTEDYDPSPELFELAVKTLSDFSREDADTAVSLIHFELRLLQLIGIMANLSECSVCGEPISTDGSFAHWVSQGGLLCSECRRQEYSGKSITAGSVAVMRKLSGMDANTSAQLTLNKQQTRECHSFAVSAITSALGRKPKNTEIH